MKLEGYVQTPQDIMEEYNGCSVPQYTAYRRVEKHIEYTQGFQRSLLTQDSILITHLPFARPEKDRLKAPSQPDAVSSEKS